MQPISYARHRFPPDIIRHAVWFYLRFTLSYRDVEDLLAERGLMVSNELIRRWVLKFGPMIAKNLRAIRPKPHSRWHLDEMMVSIAGRQMYMWRAVDSEGEVLEILVQPQRDKIAALRLLRKCFDVRASFPRLSSPTNSDPTERRFAKLASLDCTSKDCVPPIERRILISRFDDANERCKVSNQSSRRSVLFPSMRPFTTHSMYNDI